MAKKRWSDLTPAQQKGVMVGAALEVVLTAVVLKDLARRPAEGVRGPKALWVLAMVVQPFGPLGYLGFGRRATDTPAADAMIAAPIHAAAV